MPVDPTISLGVRPYEPPLGSNPLQAAQTLTGIAATRQGIAATQQGMLNTQQEMQQRDVSIAALQQQLQQAQQTFQAKQKLGATIAASPDLTTGPDAASRDPLIMSQPGVVNDVRTLQSTMADVAVKQKQLGLIGAETGRAQAGTQEALTGAARNLAETSHIRQGMGTDFYTGFSRAMLGAVSNPYQAGLVAEQFRATQPPEVAAAMKPFTDSFVQSVTPPPGLTQQQAQEYYTKNFIGRFAGAGGDAKLLVGTPGIGAGPGGVPNVEVTPPMLGPNAMAPGTATPLTQGAPTNALGGQPVLGGGSAAVAPATPAQGPLSGTGKPLFAAIPPPGPTAGSGVGLQGAGASELLKAHQGEERNSYNFATTALGALNEMDAASDRLAKAGGLLTPGSLGPARLAAAKAANTVSAMLGGKPQYTPDAVAAGELWNKDSTYLGFSTAKSLLPGQKEAVDTIDKSVDAVPSIGNTILGGKLLIGSRIAAMQRIQDQFKFNDQWANTHGGDLTGADAAFNTAFPAEDYAKANLARFGIGESGKFQSRHDVGVAFQNGLLTKPQAQKILDDQFPAQAK